MTLKPGKLNVKKGGRGQKMIDAQDDALHLALAVSEDQEYKLKARQTARKPKSQDASHEINSGGKKKKESTRKPRLERMKEVIQAKQVQQKKLKAQRRKDASGSSGTHASDTATNKRRVAFA